MYPKLASYTMCQQPVGLLCSLHSRRIHACRSALRHAPQRRQGGNRPRHLLACKAGAHVTGGAVRMRRAAMGARIALEEQLSEAEAQTTELLASLQHKSEVIMLQVGAQTSSPPRCCLVGPGR